MRPSPSSSAQRIKSAATGSEPMNIRRIILFMLAAVMMLSLTGCWGNEEITVVKQQSFYSDIDEADPPIKPAVSLSSSGNQAVEGRCAPDSYIRLSVTSEKQVSYTVRTKEGSGKWRDEKCNVRNNVLFKVPSEPCYFYIVFVPEGKSELSLQRYFRITVFRETGESMADDGSWLSASNVCIGDDKLTVYPRFKGGTPPYRYSYKLTKNKKEISELITDTEDERSSIDLTTERGCYDIIVTAKDQNDKTAKTELTFTSRRTLPLKSIYQYTEPALPTGCEATALTACINYYGFDVTKNEIADKYIDKVNFTFKNGEMIGADPEVDFAGDPNSENAYGCFSGCIIKAANKYFKSVGADYEAIRIKAKNPQELFDYLEKGQPLLVWSTMFMWDSAITDSWKTKDGKEINWKCNEHCYVLIGMSADKSEVFVADPMMETDERTIYKTKDFMKHYKELGSHAVAIVRKDPV